MLLLSGLAFVATLKIFFWIYTTSAGFLSRYAGCVWPAPGMRSGLSMRGERRDDAYAIELHCWLLCVARP